MKLWDWLMQWVVVLLIAWMVGQRPAGVGCASGDPSPWNPLGISLPDDGC